MGSSIKALFLGDVVGQPGCRAVFMELGKLIKAHNADFVIVNGENAADGFGITDQIAGDFFSNGVDVITSGNHIWQKLDDLTLLGKDSRILRPHNYPAKAPGNGFVVVEKRGFRLGVLNLIGRYNLVHVDCPFKCGMSTISKAQKESDAVVIDFHAELVDEKEALASYLDGKCACVVGTHTHIQTADERISDKGTAYISDLGMTGPSCSVIGGEPEISIYRSTTQLPEKMKVAEGDSQVNGVVVEIDVETKKAIQIYRINYVADFSS
ncbi:MAG: TIGR00282 family metallophosphoesterase [Spirochaetales bacterium]|nr:TIGR00282 family metallophosphoesterase [Spirochaetales bacterium]